MMVEDLVAMMLLILDPRVDLLMVSYIEAGATRLQVQFRCFLVTACACMHACMHACMQGHGTPVRAVAGNEGFSTVHNSPLPNRGPRPRNNASLCQHLEGAPSHDLKPAPLATCLLSDSIKDVAVNATLKLMHFLNKTNTPPAVSTLRTKNSFPLLYRAGPLAADVLPALNPPDLQLESLTKRLVAQQPGQDVLLELLLKQQEPVTIIATGACVCVGGGWGGGAATQQPGQGALLELLHADRAGLSPSVQQDSTAD
jgi:inosine-uridine nucleoside N-ribohydrolase